MLPPARNSRGVLADDAGSLACSDAAASGDAAAGALLDASSTATAPAA